MSISPNSEAHSYEKLEEYRSNSMEMNFSKRGDENGQIKDTNIPQERALSEFKREVRKSKGDNVMVVCTGSKDKADLLTLRFDSEKEQTEVLKLLEKYSKSTNLKKKMTYTNGDGEIDIKSISVPSSNDSANNSKSGSYIKLLEHEQGSPAQNTSSTSLYNYLKMKSAGNGYGTSSTATSTSSSFSFRRPVRSLSSIPDSRNISQRNGSSRSKTGRIITPYFVKIVNGKTTGVTRGDPNTVLSPISMTTTDTSTLDNDLQGRQSEKSIFHVVTASSLDSSSTSSSDSSNNCCRCCAHLSDFSDTCTESSDSNATIKGVNVIIERCPHQPCSAILLSRKSMKPKKLQSECFPPMTRFIFC